MLTSVGLVSIIVPVYNAEKYLSRCVDSLLAQTYQNIEIILIDDGSSDNSFVICRNYEERYSNIVAVHKDNSGVSDTRNIGISMANGEFISFVDSDDCVDKRMIEYCVNIQNTLSVDMVGFEWQSFVNEMPQVYHKNRINIIKGIDIEQYILIKNRLYCAVRYFYKKDIIDKNRLKFDVKTAIGEDQLFVFQYIKCCGKAAFTSYNGYYYFNNTVSASSGTVKPNHYDDIKVRHQILELCDKKNKHRAKAHLLKGYIAFCLKAIKYGSTCEENILDKYRRIIRKNIFTILFSPYIELNRKLAAVSASVSVNMTAKLLKDREL